MWKKIKQAVCDLPKRPLIFSMIIAVLLTGLLETLNTGSLFAGAVLFFTNPLLFLYNVIIVWTTLVIALLFPAQWFCVILVSLLWTVLGVVNCVLMHMRGTPLTAVDFVVFRTGYKLLHIYMTGFQIGLVIAVTVLVIAGMVVLFLRLPRVKPRYKQILPVLIAAILVAAVPMATVLRAEKITQKYPRISDAYEKYGFACCFTYSVVNGGIDRPVGYSEKNIREIVQKIQPRVETTANPTPNIIMVQMESFFDPMMIADLEYSADPMPTFRHLRKTGSGGVLRVPVVGGGTANTEFEVLCGMSLEFFGIGEYPFETVLEKKTCESVSYNLKPLGYQSHAIHNYTGTFYDRNVVYANLGFDTFTSMEYMSDYTVSPLGWIRDMELKDEIEKAMDSTSGTDFVYAVSVQGHGKYPEEAISQKPRGWITVQGLEKNGPRNVMEYYVNQVKDMDDFVGALTETLAEREEPTVVVVFGDHQPCLEIGEYTLKSGDEYETEYIIWANFPLEKQDRDLEAYQLVAAVMERLGLSSGVMPALHQKNLPAKEYKQDLEMLQYDALFGKNYAWGQTFVKTDMQMGVYPVTVTGVKKSGRVTKIQGGNFTPASRITVDGDRKETEFVSPTLLQTREKIPAGEVVVVQVAENGTVLSRSQPFLVD